MAASVHGVTGSLGAALPEGLRAAIAEIEGAGGRIALEVRLPDRRCLVHRQAVPVRSMSTIKLAILAELYRQADAGTISLAERHRVRVDEQVGGTGVLGLLDAGLEPTLGDLATLMVVVSDNTAANVLAERLGHATVHDGLRRMGLTTTRLGRPFGDRPARPGEQESVTTAAELVALLVAVVDAAAASPRAARIMTELLRAAAEVRDARTVAGAPWIGKHGFGEGVWADVGFADLPAGRLYAAVLVEDVPDGLDASGLVARLVELAVES